MTTAAIYARISMVDEKSGTNVEKTADQVTLCRAMAAERGYTVVDVYPDDGISAKTAGMRPEFDRLLTDLESRSIDVILATEESRLARNIAEKTGLMAACASVGAVIETKRDGTLNPASAQGSFMGGIRGLVDAFEVQRKGERQREENTATRAKGLPYRSGGRPFGFEPDKLTLREPEADLVRTGIEMILDGRNVNTVLRYFRESGIPTVKGGAWNRGSIVSLLRRGSNAGLVEHAREIVGEGVPEWQRIVTREQLEDVRRLLDVGGTKRTVSRLLSGIARCACGETMVSNGSQNGSYYTCSARTRGVARPGVTHASIAVGLLDDAAIAGVVKAYVSKRSAAGSADAEAQTLVGLHDDLAKVRTAQARLLDAYTDPDVPMAKSAYATKNGELVAREAELQRRLDTMVSASAHARMVASLIVTLQAKPTITADTIVSGKLGGPDAIVRANFDDLSFEDQRLLIAATVTVTVAPGRGAGRITVE